MHKIGSIACLFMVGVLYAGMPTSIDRAYGQAAATKDDDAVFKNFLKMARERKANQARCRNNDRTTDPEAQAAACTQLIDTAPHVNDLVGAYYIHRATVSLPSIDRCADVRKGIAIVNGTKRKVDWKGLVDAARRLEEVVCK